MIQSGDPDRLGAHREGDGVNFALFSGHAEAVELCLFDASGSGTQRHLLPECADGIWHGYLPGCPQGQRYGYRLHGPYEPARGLRFNPGKLLIDPYARALEGTFTWNAAVFDFEPETESHEFRINEQDSAPFVPKSVVTGPGFAFSGKRPRIPWADTVIYEANVRGYTMRHPAVSHAERGKFRGMRNGEILRYLKALGITAIELMPVHAFIDEAALDRRGLRNFWGYNSINFFTAESRYAGADPAAEFREMVEAIHEAGMEVILDVAYNHTGESDERGPSLSFRGIDNLAYYRTVHGEPGRYVNVTGCGNSLNTDHPRVRDLVVDSLRYWYSELGVDGFRFDLASTLGRHGNDFEPDHPLLARISSDQLLEGAKLIAEPWDAAPGGYQLGAYPAPWAEWNDRFRDSVRRFWRGDPGEAGELARRLHGSSDLFETSDRNPTASVNFITAHDGMTLRDLVSHERRHNEANGESNRDGHANDYGCNYGCEGRTDDAAINRTRRRQRLNMLATLLLSRGVPILLAGDEFGNSQGGNNNAYCQDNETGWLDWPALDADPEFAQLVRSLIRLRRDLPSLRQESWPHGIERLADGWTDIEWRHPSGREMDPQDWDRAMAFTLILASADQRPSRGDELTAAAVLLNASKSTVEFSLPANAPGSGWQLAFTTGETNPGAEIGTIWTARDKSITVLLSGV